MRTVLPALASGILFGAGLAVSDMINPSRVLGFLDLAGSWDPTLAFVMIGAVLASAIGYVVSRRLRAPIFGRSFFIPENRQLDSQLIGGAVLFGIGWGMVGFCPGPAIAGLAFGMWQAWLFVAAMIIGMFLHRVVAGLRRMSPMHSPTDA
ncbi:YeeE/YedE family protein [Sphingomonas daechungensis]|uniref:YeeE/YedE family protein n=1 Tax=Sphingomonas daechungensis TaxID=1176646 RepID=UPI0031EAF9AA